MLDLTVICGTCGDQSWIDLANQRAIPSGHRLNVPVVHAHGENVADGRNQALAQVETEWVVCCDADDELELGFDRGAAQGSADVRGPRVRCCREGRSIAGGLFMPRCAGHRHDCSRECLPYGNWLVVGSVARTELLQKVGGWESWVDIYEDWHLWLKCYREGASFEAIPHAIYRQHLRQNSRNHVGPAYEAREEWHRRIVEDVLGRAHA